MVLKFICGFCGKFTGTRKGLRKHLSEKHLRNELFNTTGSGNRGIQKFKRKEIITKEFA